MINVTDIAKRALEGDKEATNYLKSIKMGLYLKVFNPTERLWEQRKKDGPLHIMDANSVVIKPGKFEGNLYNRIKAYNDSWFTDQNEKAYLDNVTIYLLQDLTSTSKMYARYIEHIYINIVDKLVITKKHEKAASSEWRLCPNGILETDINNIHNELIDEIMYDSNKISRREMYNLDSFQI